ncbi:hypothetical protein M0R45_019242 [Rubus argutus]|uniref:Uncharacterized protein n=1 Tax=Rubus argutus TaxID=59490 RepID=A0AAW1X794_RUBAR
MPPRHCHLEEPSPSSFATPPTPLRLHHLSPSSPPSSDHWSPAGVSNSHGHRLYPRRCKDKEMKEATDHGLPKFLPINPNSVLPSPASPSKGPVIQSATSLSRATEPPSNPRPPPSPHHAVVAAVNFEAQPWALLKPASPMLCRTSRHPRAPPCAVAVDTQRARALFLCRWSQASLMPHQSTPHLKPSPSTSPVANPAISITKSETHGLK